MSQLEKNLRSIERSFTDMTRRLTTLEKRMRSLGITERTGNFSSGAIPVAGTNGSLQDASTKLKYDLTQSRMYVNTTLGMAAVNTQSLEIGGAEPTNNNSQATLLLHDYNTVAHQLRYTNGTLFFEAAGPATGYSTTSNPRLVLPIIVVDDWIIPPFQNSWISFGGGYAPPGYCKTPMGMVHLRGVLKGGVVGAPAFTLPASFRPIYKLALGTISNETVGRVDVNPDGTVVPFAPSNNAWVSLDGLIFRAEQ